jgi:glutaredoxin
MSQPIEVYWMPGCTACLRMKEFVETTGLKFTAINAAEDKTGQEKLKRLGATVPCTIVGDEWAQGIDLAAVAKLIGAPYDAPAIMPPDELAKRYIVISETLQRLMAQADAQVLDTQLPGRPRNMLNVGYHAASVMRLFLQVYDPEIVPEGGRYVLEPTTPLAPGIENSKDVIAHARETLGLFNEWWSRDGQDDPLDRVELGYWGHRTLLEQLEREVWHTAQHTRQLAFFLEECGVKPDRPLGERELAGLPLPQRVHA